MMTSAPVPTLWTAIADRLDARRLVIDGVPFRSLQLPSKNRLLRAEFGGGSVHDEWIARSRARLLQVCLHTEYKTEGESSAAFRPILDTENDVRKELASATPRSVHLGNWGINPNIAQRQRWRELRVDVPARDPFAVELAAEAESLMVAPIQVSFPR